MVVARQQKDSNEGSDFCGVCGEGVVSFVTLSIGICAFYDVVNYVVIKEKLKQLSGRHVV